MSKFSTSDRERLTELLEEELELIEQMYSLCREQTNMISGDTLAKLDASFGKAGELREQIKGLHQETDMLMQSYVSATEDRENDDISKLSGKVTEKLLECAKINEENMAKMDVLAKELSDKIDKQKSKRETIGGYSQVVPNNPEMFDKKS